MAALSVWTTGGACASSFVHVAPPTDKVSRSIVVMGGPAPRAEPVPANQARPDATPLPSLALAVAGASRAEPVKVVAISRSIVAFDTPVPPVTHEKVAAIGKRPATRWQPIVIRGGIVAGVPGATAEPVTLPPATTPRSPAKAQADTRRQAQAGKAPVPSRPAPEPIEAGPPPSRAVMAPR